MKRHLLVASASLALTMSLAAPGAVVAQDTSTTGAATAPVNAVDAQELIGRNIQDAAGETVGDIEGVVIDGDGQASLPEYKDPVVQ